MKPFRLPSILLVICVILVAGVAPVMAQAGNQWRIEYFNNPDWAGFPVMTETRSFASFDWGHGSPGPLVPADNFTARLTTDAFFYAGNYTFSVVADDEVVLIVDGTTRLDTRGRGQSGKAFSITLPMAQGMRRIEVLYREWSVTAYLFVNWAYAGEAVTPPVVVLPPLPASATSVVTQFGDFTRCIQQGLHQAECFVSSGWDSPDVGSIRMEPQIQSWVNCEPADRDQDFFINPTVPSRGFRCSKSLAGWFPR